MVPLQGLQVGLVGKESLRLRSEESLLTELRHLSFPLAFVERDEFLEDKGMALRQAR